MSGPIAGCHSAREVAQVPAREAARQIARIPRSFPLAGVLSSPLARGLVIAVPFVFMSAWSSKLGPLAHDFVLRSRADAGDDIDR
jgi:hypothetical protein